MLLPGREWQEGYRFGFNGYDNTTEIDDMEVILDFGGRMYNSRIGKFISVDPLYRQYNMWSPYSFAFDQPITLIDYLGFGPIDPRDWERMSSKKLVRPGIFSGKTVIWLNTYKTAQFTENNTWTAHDQSLINWGNTVTRWGDESIYEKLLSETEDMEAYYKTIKIAEGSEFYNRFGYEDDRVKRNYEDVSGYTIMQCGWYGNYDFKIVEKNSFSVYEVTDGIITGIINYQKNMKDEYEIVSSTSFIILKTLESTITETIVEQQDTSPDRRVIYTQTHDVWRYDVTEINYDVKTNVATTKKYTQRDNTNYRKDY